jgi:nitrogen fixation protein FixH
MVHSLVLVEAKDVKKESLMMSLSNAKQIVLRQMPGTGDWIVHVTAMALADLEKALLKFAKVAGVTGVLTLLIRS